MHPIRLVLATTSLVLAALAAHDGAHADGLHAARFGARGDNAALGGQRGLVVDGNGQLDGASRSGFATANGAEGLRTQRMQRSADGSVQASGQAHANGANGGTADRSGSFTRSADGTASGERSTSVSNALTGVNLNGSTTYTQGSGFSRSVNCTDSAGNSVTCGPR